MSEVRRADMEALMAPGANREGIVGYATANRNCTEVNTLVDTRTIGKALTFTGEHKDWPEWSFQFLAYMGSVNPKSIDALGSDGDDKVTPAVVTQKKFR